MGKGGCTAAGRAARSKAQGQPDLSEGCVRRDDAYKVFILIRSLLNPNKMRRRHLESVSSRSLSVRGSWGAAPSVFWYGAPGGTRGPLGKGGAAERWRVTPSVSGVTRHGAQPATTHTHKRNASAASRTGLAPCGDSAPPKATANPAPAASGANYAFAKGFRRQAPTNYPPHKKSFLQNPSQNGTRIFSPPLSRAAVFSPHKV